MKRKSLLVIVLALVFSILPVFSFFENDAQAAHKHSYTIAATCYYPKRCSCGATSGSPLGHTYGSWTTTRSANCATTGTKERKCIRCTSKQTETIPKTSTHSYGSWQTTRAATCAATGERKRQCSVCKSCQYETIPKNGVHSMVAATCTSPRHCSRCSYSETSTVLGHNFGSWTVTQNATCGATGIKERKCSRCSVRETATIPKTTTHSYGSWQTTRAATCAATGERRRQCSVCKCYQYESVPKNGVHDIIAATCTSPRHCSRCSYSETSTVLGHNFGSWTITRNATCAATGTKERKCSRCTVSETATIPKTTTHSYGSWQTTKAATCAATGERRRQCSVCKCYQYETIPKSSGHNMVPATCTSPKHCSVCSYCDTSSVLGHNFGNWTVIQYATCTTTGIKERKCSRCTVKETAGIPKTNTHSFGSWQTTVSATCTSAGTEKRTCTVSGCNAYETRTIPAPGHSYSSQWLVETPANCSTYGTQYCLCVRCNAKQYSTIPKNNVHDIIPATCTSPKHCSRCSYSDTSTVLNHSFGAWKTTVYATCTTEGTQKRTCTRSGCTAYETSSIPKTPHTCNAWEIIEEADCVSTGTKRGKCNACGETLYESIPVDDTKHVFENGICKLCNLNTNTEVIFLAGENGEDDCNINSMKFENRSTNCYEEISNNPNLDIKSGDYNFDEVSYSEILNMIDTASYFTYTGHGGHKNGDLSTYMCVNDDGSCNIGSESIKGLDLSNIYVASLQCCCSAGALEIEDLKKNYGLYTEEVAKESIGYAMCENGANMVIGFNVSILAVKSDAFTQQFNKYYAQILENAAKIDDSETKKDYIIDTAFDLAMAVAKSELGKYGDSDYLNSLVVFRKEDDGTVSINRYSDEYRETVFELDPYTTRMKFIDERYNEIAE